MPTRRQFAAGLSSVALALLLAASADARRVHPNALLAPPANLHQTASTETTTSTSWNAVTGAAKYGIAYDGAQVATTTHLGYTRTGLVCGSSYQVKVRSYNSANRAGAYSAPLTASTAACSGGGGAPVGSTIFHAGEAITDWDAGGGGGLYNSGQFTAAMDSAHVHSGTSALKATIWTPNTPTSGVRAFRWAELQQNRTLILRSWVYIPTAYVLTGDPCCGRFWNLMQIKTKNQDGSRTDPVLALHAENINGTLMGHINWGSGGLQLAGPHAGDAVSIKNYYATAAPIPVGQWVKLTFQITQASDYTGAFAAWINDTQIVDLQNIVTAYRVTGVNAWNTNNHFSADNYSDGLSPNPAAIWIDDYEEATP